MYQPQPLNVLFLEDDADTREMVTVLLKQSNIEVASTKTPVEALQLADLRAFDAFLLDGMGSAGGSFGLCRILRSKFPTTPVIFYSGEGHDVAIRRAMAAGATEYLVKPFDGDLAGVVTDCIRESGVVASVS